MLKALSYYSAVLKDPAKRDFIDMGFGIDARFKRSQDFWKRHLKLCKEFAEDALKDYEDRGKAWILGAGSLLDIDLSLLERKFSEVTLCDANSSLRKRWQQSFAGLALKTNFIFEDITGSMEILTTELAKISQRTKDISLIIEFLNTIQLREARLPAECPDVVFSVNLLSQIPIYWRDRVHSVLSKKLGIETNEQGNYESELQAALEGSMRALQNQHLVLLKSSKARNIILITDSEFLYYVKDKSLWQSEKSLFIDDLEISNYSLRKEDSWFWHIAPQGIENKNYGVIHNVKAISFRKI